MAGEKRSLLSGRRRSRLSGRGRAASAPGSRLRWPFSTDLSDPTRPAPSYWAETAAMERPGAPLTGEISADVAIIGGGYTGLSAALTLARDYGVAAAVLEAGDIGFGASGRNGGLLCLDCTKLSLAQIRRRVGEAETTRYFAVQAEAIRHLRELISEEGVSCDVIGETTLELATSARSFEGMAATAEAYGRFPGVAAATLSPERLAEERFASPAAHGALELRPGGGLHPLKLALGLARAAARRGASLFPQSQVEVWERDGAEHVLRTRKGAVRARYVALATNGFTPDGLNRAYDGRATPILSNIGVTRPLTDDELAAHAWRETQPLYDDKRLLRYFRMLPDRRFLLGMRGDVRGDDAGAARMRARVRAGIDDLFPAWSRAEITHFWRGPICATAHRAPTLGFAPDDRTVAHALGYHGAGVTTAVWCGAALARLIAEGEAGLEGAPALFLDMAPKLPLPGLRPLYVRGAIAWNGVLDRLGL